MSEPLDAKEMWDALTYDQRLAATAEVFEAICEHAKSSGSFRYLIYNRLKFNHDAYSCLYAAGGMAISNMCNDCKELVDEPEESSTYLPPKPDSDSQPLAQRDTSSNTLSNTTHLLNDIVKLPVSIQELMRKNNIVFDNTSDKMQMFALSLYTDIVQLHSRATEILEADTFTAGPPWINMKDETPPKLRVGTYKKYLICRGNIVQECRWTGGDRWILSLDGAGDITDLVTHWMPMPQGPLKPGV